VFASARNTENVAICKAAAIEPLEAHVLHGPTLKLGTKCCRQLVDGIAFGHAGITFPKALRVSDTAGPWVTRRQETGTAVT
jgi:hypothetical protein